MLFTVAYKRKYKKEIALEPSDRFSARIEEPLDGRYGYKIRLRGGVGIPYAHRTEDVYPLYFRKIDDSLILREDGYTLEFNARNFSYERSCYCMLRGEFPLGKPLTLSVRGNARGVNDNLFLQAEVYYGEPYSRYYYEGADETILLPIGNTDGYETFQTQLSFSKKPDFVMLKLSGVGFDGTASFYAPRLEDGAKNYVPPFTFEPQILRGQKWIGEGFSWTERPYFEVSVNGKKIFTGIKRDRLQCLCGVEFAVPNDVLKPCDNQVEIAYGAENKICYVFNELQLLRLPKETEILGVAKEQTAGKEFGVLCYFPTDEERSVSTDCSVRYLGEKKIDGAVSVLRFLPERPSKSSSIRVRVGDTTRSCRVCISESKKDRVLTGSGDFIYVPQDEEAFYEYMAWYLNEGVGDMLTLRSCYRWGGTAESSPSFWEKAVDLLESLGVYYALMIDGRELNGVNANPDKSQLQGKYFLGEQTHERDGAFTYWVQDVDEYESFFYHLLSRKLQRNGIYGKHSPVYEDGRARIFYPEKGAKDVKEAYENLLCNISRTAADGATRHTGVTPLFDVFFKAGYRWLGLESMYGNHEILFGALRGASHSVGQESYGAHLALQWASVPCDDEKHALRYRLSLYSSYMHGVDQINTEEGLWNIENPFEGFDRFSYACKSHVREQARFNAFVKRHDRTGTQVRKIAMMVGNYDGMDCFSTGSVYGQKGEYWDYASSEYSWDLLKTFYPQAKLGSLYHFIKKGGKEGLRKKDKAYLDAWGYMFGEKEKYDSVKDYESLGYFSSSPYGAIDLIAGDAENLDDYEFIFLLGWNTCTDAQLQRFCAYMERGGVLMLAKSHLYENTDRKEVFTGGGRMANSPWLNTLFGYKERGNLIYFDEDGYPTEFKDLYAARLQAEGERFSCRCIADVEYVSFTEYRLEDGSEKLYLLNIDWWDGKAATCSVVLDGEKYPLSIADNFIKTLSISPSGKTAIFCEDERIDVCAVSDEEAILRGFANAEITVFAGGSRKVFSVRVDGERILKW